jgi:hypothetical protein
VAGWEKIKRGGEGRRRESMRRAKRVVVKENNRL